MNTKVKVWIAAAIVAALVALIVLDQKTAPHHGTPVSGGTDTDGVTLGSPSSDQALRVLREEGVQEVLRKSRETFSSSTQRQTEAPVRVAEPAPPTDVRGSVKTDEYVIQSGDTLETIAQGKYGSRTFQSLITDANPGLRPGALRIGQKIVLPLKSERVEKQVEDPVVKVVPADTALGADRVYVVQAGDTLTQISSKLYKTSRYVNQILEANRTTLSDAHFLTVGMKLTMPDLAVRNAAASPATAATALPAPTGKAHTVATGESLWKIAERYAAGKGLGVIEMIQLIVQANPDKLKDDKTLLRLGWQLIVPE